MERRLHPLSSFAPLQSRPSLIRWFRRSRAFAPDPRSVPSPPRVTLAHAARWYRSVPPLRSAVRSPDDASPEVSRPISAISSASPFFTSASDRSSVVAAVGLPHPPRFRLQGFSPSWRLAPRGASPAYFIRQALSGLPPSRAFPSHAAVSPPGNRCPPAVSTLRACSNGPRLQGLAPRQSPPASRSCFHFRARRVALLGFLPSRVSPASPWRRFRGTSSPLSRLFHRRLASPASSEASPAGAPASDGSEGRCLRRLPP
jgi:hypothetical protein